ncbi:GTPase [Marinicella sp. W31]|uniref:GTPase n=1 Tax=Marinicella sp. W31 TaxID=3023713 RepID=UPI0037568400
MKLNLKAIILAFIILASLISLLLVLMLTEKLLVIWQNLKSAPVWMVIAYAMAISLVAAFSVYLYLRLIRTKPTAKKTVVVDERSLQTSIEEEQLRGVDTHAAELELLELQKRRQQGLFYIALFGQASAGKSSLVKALMPQLDISSDVRSGTTQEIGHYQYEQLMITDLPGFDAVDEQQPELEQMALDEGKRAHVVIYLLDADISKTQMQWIEQLSDLKKPLVVALNKIDRYDAQEQMQLLGAIHQKLNHRYPVVRISTGGAETVIYQHADGSETRQIKENPPQITALIDAIQHVLEKDPDALHRFRDAGLLLLAHDKLEQARHSFDYQKAETTITSYTKKAVAGALASVAPGSDLVIQAAIATKFIREICGIYSIQPKQIEIDQILKLTGGKLRTSTSLILAVAGNACKAFPGIGTAAGGLMHAVAYGMIFNALGRAVLTSIVTQGELNTAVTKSTFEENLLGHSTQMAKDLAQMALQVNRRNRNTKS